MAHYAFLDKNNIVTEVIVGVNETELIDGQLPEVWYSHFRGQECVRTSYNTQGNKHLQGGTPFRKNYASVGYSYDRNLDAFIPPSPYNSWKLNYETYTWEAPIPKPLDETGYKWVWVESNQEWIKILIPQS
jgi:hypothetical protein